MSDEQGGLPKPAAARRFARFVTACSPADPLLPVTHTTDGWGLSGIVADRKLTAIEKCDVFQENLLYCFYGRPAYRVDAAKQPASLHCFSLACFVLHPDVLPSPRRVFPFDSGAMHKGLYGGHMHPRMTVDDFEMNASIAEAAKLVNKMYGTNSSYFAGKALAGLSFPVLDMEAECYYSLISNAGRSAADDRRGSVELSFNQDIPLLPGAVMAVVLPEDFWDDPTIATFVKRDLMAEPLSYACYHASPTEDTRAIMMVVREFLKEKMILV